MEKEYFTKVNPNAFLSKDEAKESYLSGKDFERELNMRGYLPIYKFNQFLIGTGIAVLLIFLDFKNLGLFLLLAFIVYTLLANAKEIKNENKEYNKKVQDKKNNEI